MMKLQTALLSFFLLFLCFGCRYDDSSQTIYQQMYRVELQMPSASFVERIRDSGIFRESLGMRIRTVRKNDDITYDIGVVFIEKSGLSVSESKGLAKAELSNGLKAIGETGFRLKEL